MFLEDIATKYTETWKEYVTDLMIEVPEFDVLSDETFLIFKLHLGFLIDWFSKHGIEIERIMVYGFDEHKHFVRYRVLQEDNKGLVPKGTFKTLPKAIAKACEILEAK